MALSGSTSQKFKDGFQCGLAATPQHLESLASCVTDTGYCVPAGYLGVGVITHRRKTALEQVPSRHSLRELKEAFDQCSEIVGVSDPCESLPSQEILCFYVVLQS